MEVGREGEDGGWNKDEVGGGGERCRKGLRGGAERERWC